MPSVPRATDSLSGPPTASTPIPRHTATPCASCRRWPATTSPASSPTATETWVATHGNGLYRLDGALQVTGRYDAASNPGLVSDYIRVPNDFEGCLDIGTFDGAFIRDPQSGRFERHVHTSDPGSLSHNSIRSIFIDAQRGVWLGHFTAGVSYYHPLARRFGILRHDPVRNSLGDNTVSCIVEDPFVGEPLDRHQRRRRESLRPPHGAFLGVQHRQRRPAVEQRQVRASRRPRARVDRHPCRGPELDGRCDAAHAPLPGQRFDPIDNNASPWSTATARRPDRSFPPSFDIAAYAFRATCTSSRINWSFWITAR